MFYKSQKEPWHNFISLLNGAQMLGGLHPNTCMNFYDYVSQDSLNIYNSLLENPNIGIQVEHHPNKGMNFSQYACQDL